MSAKITFLLNSTDTSNLAYASVETARKELKEMVKCGRRYDLFPWKNF